MKHLDYNITICCRHIFI